MHFIAFVTSASTTRRICGRILSRNRPAEAFWVMCSPATIASTRWGACASDNLTRLGQDLAPKNELCDEFLFTSHIMAAWPVEIGKLKAKALLPLALLKDDIMAATRAAMLSEPLPLVPLPSRIVWLSLGRH